MLCALLELMLCVQLGLVSATGLGIYLELMKSIDPFKFFFKVF